MAREYRPYQFRDGDDLSEVRATARRLSRKNDRTYYVVYEPDHTGKYHAADDTDLDTFYDGISDRNILYCTSDENGSALTPVIAILTAFTVAAVLIAQSGLLHTICARLAEVR